MRMLLDTHTFLWFINGDDKLTEASRLLIQNIDNEVFISVVTLWEIAIKISLGKLSLLQDFSVLIPRELNSNEFLQLPIKLKHLIQLGSLPFYHRDPFDRLLIAQSLSEQIPIISRDVIFDDYKVQRIW